MIIHQALPERDNALPPAIDRKRLRGLEIKLLTALSKSKCNSWEAWNRSSRSAPRWRIRLPTTRAQNCAPCCSSSKCG